MPNTFAQIPEVGVAEIWDWITDIIISKNGTEQRLSLRENPRITVDANFELVTEDRRTEFLQVIDRSLRNVVDTPIWPYLSRIKVNTAATAVRIYFDPAKVPVVAGGVVVLINERTRETYSYRVYQVETDGATLEVPLTNDITTEFYAILGFKAIIENEASSDIRYVTTDYKVTFISFEEHSLDRPGSNVVFEEFDDLIVLNKTALGNANDEYTYDKEIIDYKIGVRDFNSLHPTTDVMGTRTYKIDRLTTNEFDFWRKFFMEVRGAQKAFLLPSGLSDMTLRVEPNPGVSQIQIKERDIGAAHFLNEIYRRIQIQYADGSTTNHKVMGSTLTAQGITITLNPELPDDDRVASITRICHLLKVRSSDTVRIGHGGFASLIAFDFRTTSEG